MILVQPASGIPVGWYHDRSVYRHVLDQVGTGLTLSHAPACASSDENFVHLMALEMVWLRFDAVWRATTPKALSGAYAGSGNKRDAGAMLITVLL